MAVEYVTTDDGNQKIEDAHQNIATSPQDFIGKTFWYVPNPKSSFRIVFFSKLEDKLNYKPVAKFTPLEKTTFEVKGVHQLSREDDYTYEVQFPDGKVGYIKGRAGFEGHIYRDYLDPINEYIFTEDSEVILAREKQKEELAQKENEIALKKELEANKIREAEQIAQDKKAKKAASVAKAKWKARGGVSIGMTKSEALASNWGKPNDINRTTTANGTEEQWVFDGGYLYFTNGKLTAIQN